MLVFMRLHLGDEVLGSRQHKHQKRKKKGGMKGHIRKLHADMIFLFFFSLHLP